MANDGRFKPGQIANPKGRPTIPEGPLRAVSLLTRGEVKALISKFARIDVLALQDEMKKMSLTAIERMVISHWVKASSGDRWSTDFLMNRSIGVPKPEQGEDPEKLAIAAMSTSELLEKIKVLMPEAKQLLSKDQANEIPVDSSSEAVGTKPKTDLEGGN